MSRERNQSADVQHAKVSPNEAMNSYIGDLLWPGSSPEPEKDSEVVHECLSNNSLPKDSLLSISNSVKPGFSLIPLVSLDRYQLNLSNPQRSLSASFLLLLWGLHLLRMPIAGRLRLSVVEHCRERIVEYRLLTEISRLPVVGGIYNE